MELNKKDIEVIKAAQQGDAQAFTKLYEKYHRLAYYIAYKHCHNQADAQDIVQETFLDIRSSIKSLREPQSFKVWFYRVVSNKCKKMFRKNQHIESDYDGSIAAKAIEERRDFIPNKQIRFKSDREVLLHYIDELNPAQREVVMLFYLEQLSLKEIADVTGDAEGTIKSRLSYARKYLHTALSEYQAKEEEPITFRSLDTLLLSALTYDLANCLPLIKADLIFSKKTWRLTNKLPHILIASCAGVFITQAAMQSYDSWKLKSNLQPNVSQTFSSPLTFQTVQFQNEQVDNARDAYFTLMNWACCEEEIERKPMQEIEERVELYTELKRYGGTYYDFLQKEDWNIAFEQRMMRKN